MDETPADSTDGDTGSRATGLKHIQGKRDPETGEILLNALDVIDYLRTRVADAQAIAHQFHNEDQPRLATSWSAIATAVQAMADEIDSTVVFAASGMLDAPGQESDSPDTTTNSTTTPE